MPFSNLQYLYDHLPARYRRDDEGLFLKRFLAWYGETLDAFDAKRDNLPANINPDTATEEWITYLLSFFGWGWRPAGYTLDQMRALLRFIPQLYARRGTVRGIQECMAFFGAPCIVEAQSYFWEEVAWGEAIWLTEPLTIVVRVLSGASLTSAEIEELLRFQWPVGHVIYIENLPEQQQPSPLDTLPLWGDGTTFGVPGSPLDALPDWNQIIFGEGEQL